MKRTLLVIGMIITFSGGLLSQEGKPLGKGNIIIGGSTSISHAKYTYPGDPRYASKSFSASLSPSALFFVADHFAAGMSLDFYHQNTNGRRSTRIGIGPMLRYYMDNGLLFGLSASGYFSELYSGFDNKSYTVTLHPYIGYAWFLNSKISLEPNISYAYEVSISTARIEPDISLKRNFQFSIGFSKFL